MCNIYHDNILGEGIAHRLQIFSLKSIEQLNGCTSSTDNTLSQSLGPFSYARKLTIGRTISEPCTTVKIQLPSPS